MKIEERNASRYHCPLFCDGDRVHYCKGHYCMAWEWSDDITEQGLNIGYCGMTQGRSLDAAARQKAKQIKGY